MEPRDGLIEDTWSKSIPVRGLSPNPLFSDQPFAVPGWENPFLLDYTNRMETPFPKFNQAFENQIGNVNDGLKNQDWDPRAMLNSLSLLEQKIHQLQDLVHMIVGRRDQGVSDDPIVQQQQQLVSADLTSIISQLISTAGCLLPANLSDLGAVQQNVTDSSAVMEQIHNNADDHEQKDEDDHDHDHDHDPNDDEHLPPGSYEILQLEKEEILAPHTHFCTICGKGFKRDANLRMHMRGHGDEYKSPAALAKPHVESNSSEPVLPKRYSCPYVGCKRNKDHRKFQPLKTILCVKNHYKRTHCDKTYTCSRCNTKKFSVIADLKTHEKHCGRDKWLCSCGTTFSRKDKLFGHIALFQGHTPAIPLEENKGSSSAQMENGESSNSKIGFGFGQENGMDMKGSSVDDAYFSMLGFDGYSLGGLQELSQAGFGDPESCFSFLLPGNGNGSRNGMQTDGSDC